MFAWSPFSTNDVLRCYPEPAWVAARFANYPQPAVGNGLRDPLPIPFTTQETSRALKGVWFASHHPLNRACADVNPVSVRIAWAVLSVLQRRNGGWIDFDAGRPVVVGTSMRGQGVNLKCVLYKLVGKPLPPVHNWCNVAPPAQSNIYNIRDVRTTFDGTAGQLDPYRGIPRPLVVPKVVMDAPGGEGSALVGGFFGHEIEQVSPTEPDPFTYSLFEISAVFDIKEV